MRGSAEEHAINQRETPNPYWKKAHRDWRFWVAVFFVFLALAIYIGSADLSLIPRAQPSLTHPATQRYPP